MLTSFHMGYHTHLCFSYKGILRRHGSPNQPIDELPLTLQAQVGLDISFLDALSSRS